MRNILTVFIASPSDLEVERKTAFDIVAELNLAIKQIHWSIELLGWEDTLPGYGRPQSLINGDVERCDLFIGLMWQRWGAPPADSSPFSSGFEEEFSIARNRHEETSTPQIWMFFKKVEAAQINDPGAQLQKVIAFRDSLVQSKKLLFKQFDCINSWEKMLRSYLLRHVLEISGAQNNSPSGPSERGPSLPITSSEGQTSDSFAAGEQLANVARALAPSFETGDVSQIVMALENENEVTFLAVRALLLSAALVLASGSTSTPLPTHELNSLYRYRERLCATADEIYVIFRSILADDSDVHPGCYWFKDLSDQKILELLFQLLLFDQNTNARATTLDILRQSSIPIPVTFRTPFLESFLPTISSDLHNAAWAYLVDVATAEDVEQLRGAVNGSWLEARIEWLHAWVGSGRTLDHFLPQNPDPQLVPTSMKLSIKANIPQLSIASLRALVSSPEPNLRDLALQQMRTNAALPDSTLSPSGTPVTLGSMLALGAPKMPGSERHETDDERYQRLKGEGTEILRTSLSWYKSDAHVAYRLLGERGDIPIQTIRDDVSSGFRRIQEKSNADFEQKYGAEQAAKWAQGFEDLREFIKSQFTASAFKYLERCPTAEDAALARQFLDYQNTLASALRIIASVGDSTDVDSLIEKARLSYGEDRLLALTAVRQLSLDKLKHAKMLIESAPREMQRAGLSLSVDLCDEEALTFLEELLSHDAGEIRVGAILQLRKRVNDQTLEEVLHRYLNRERYYYNVVVWLDRWLYAPPLFLKYYENERNNKMQV